MYRAELKTRVVRTIHVVDEIFIGSTAWNLSESLRNVPINAVITEMYVEENGSLVLKFCEEEKEQQP